MKDDEKEVRARLFAQCEVFEKIRERLEKTDDPITVFDSIDAATRSDKTQTGVKQVLLMRVVELNVSITKFEVEYRCVRDLLETIIKPLTK